MADLGWMLEGAGTGGSVGAAVQAQQPSAALRPRPPSAAVASVRPSAVQAAHALCVPPAAECVVLGELDEPTTTRFTLFLGKPSLLLTAVAALADGTRVAPYVLAPEGVEGVAGLQLVLQWVPYGTCHRARTSTSPERRLRGAKADHLPGHLPARMWLVQRKRSGVQASATAQPTKHLKRMRRRCGCTWNGTHTPLTGPPDRLAL